MGDVEEEQPLRIPFYLAMWQKTVIALLVYFAVTCLIAGISVTRYNSIALGERNGSRTLEGGGVLVATGYAPILVRLGDRYGLLSQNNGLELRYSMDGTVWTDPIQIHGWKDPLRVGHQGYLMRRSDSSLVLAYAQPDPRDPFYLEILLTTSQDGYNWSTPTILNTTPLRIVQVWGISMIETPDNNVVLALAADGFGIATFTTRDGVRWQGPNRRRSITTFGGISIIEIEGQLYAVYADSSIWLGRWEEPMWHVTRIAPKEYVSYMGAVSITRLGSGLVVVAFDHLNGVYLTSSRDMHDWDRPFKVAEGDSPTISPYGDNTIILAYHHDHDHDDDEIRAIEVNMEEWIS